jgi:hypothetical protein
LKHHPVQNSYDNNEAINNALMFRLEEARDKLRSRYSVLPMIADE